MIVLNDPPAIRENEVGMGILRFSHKQSSEIKQNMKSILLDVYENLSFYSKFDEKVTCTRV